MSNVIRFPIEDRQFDIAYNRVSELFFKEFGDTEEYTMMMNSIEEIMEDENFSKQESIDFLNTVKIHKDNIKNYLNDNEVSNVR